MATHLKSVHPHIRGAYGRQWLPFRCPSRFIPTYVGHTTAAWLSALLKYGSSPHTWGIPFLCPFTGLKARFIPTYVGHTCGPHGAGWGGTVHPHIRGAYLPSTAFQPGAGGSSPHTWGIPQGHGQPGGPTRFIPTYVGHTDYNRSGSDRCFGSSPHTWGIHKIVLGWLTCTRFIPTYVGHTNQSFLPHL